MTKVFAKAIGILALSGIASTAFAGWSTNAHVGFATNAPNYASTSGPAVTSAPEIDPASAISGLTLLLGGLAVVRGRRAKK